MAKRVKVEKVKAETKTEAVEEVEPKVPENAEALKDELDELLESIDEALGENLENALAFTSSFIQKGGQ